ncbi:hypothetical protein ACFFWC_23480 [Plantactinospora siamensis]|uniref:DUF5753 domain-containing protein n=1 Tax=Plantactinospora siamensis TaxID=555372 RepID=A0ABV6NUM6_9ACTN
MPDEPLRGRAWKASDRTGGPLDDLLDALRRQHPTLVVERLGKTHPTDDDNVYFLGLGHVANIVQVDTGPNGQPPFLIEAEDRVYASNPTEALTAVQTRLKPPH